jgi:hypothetical protein
MFDIAVRDVPPNSVTIVDAIGGLAVADPMKIKLDRLFVLEKWLTTELSLLLPLWLPMYPLVPSLTNIFKNFASMKTVGIKSSILTLIAKSVAMTRDIFSSVAQNALCILVPAASLMMNNIT